MSDNDSPRQWQVTCVCGWRTMGAKSEVVANVTAHGKEAHQQNLTEDQVMSQATPLD
ncbi:MAG: hypothetical protein O2854_00095 [Chloroflexi bacterium]|nr:hypothetical protein [Chloroflexota bacterium]